MSGLRFFEDLMTESIEMERRVRELNARRVAYVEKCERERAEALRMNTDCRPSFFHAVTEGLCAARIIGSL